MRTLSLLIVEDEDSDFDHFTDLLNGYSEDAELSFEVERKKSGAEFKGTEHKDFDLAFFDIDLKDANGIDLAKSLREKDKNVGIVFITNLAQFAIKGYEVNALDFLVKPIAYYDFYLKMNKIVSSVKERGVEIIISNQNNFIKINSDEIMYAEIRHHEVYYHTTGGIIKTYGTLKELESKLNPSVFVRCNNCFLVNLNYVTGIEGYDAIIGDERILISHPKKKEFMKAVNDHYNGVL